ncbi:MULTISPECIES: hypothetical protein [unclassified Beijerinckia]|uniref:hypothetical protein n=1 Tax=unclassified Beijerinckia TaxID=2638183 RepID=UPI00089484B6|nr:MULTISPECIES: hypothetical protein [unclassified Beijerinckia]MDH7794951.1 hypothetical protein [Beijerinckia sp. GAS462]SEB81666.1 hypothetical protein SAMN05443249_1224 [Beijerinckia sp. 28-YEA-48]
MIDHPNAKSSSTMKIVESDGLKTVIVVDTDLKLNRDDPGYDGVKLQSLRDACKNYVAAHHGQIDRYSIRSWN